MNITLFNDNQFVNIQTNDQIPYKKARYIHIMHHFVKETSRSAIVKLEYLNTDRMIAYVRTKALSTNKYSKFGEAYNLLGLR